MDRVESFSVLNWASKMLGPVPLGAAMRRRDFLSAVAIATAWPLAARAQQPAMPVVGFLSMVPTVPHLTAAFRQGLA